MWNGRAVNANQFFSNEAGQGTPFNNFNQWQTGVQGPIWKNHTFFDVDYEGLRNVLPTASTLTLIPSPQFQSGDARQPHATRQCRRDPILPAGICYLQQCSRRRRPRLPSRERRMPGTLQDWRRAYPCALQFRTTPPNTNREYHWSARVDHIFSETDRFYIRVLRDNGFQPTYTSPFGPTFNAQSNQPQMTGQVSETHIFGPNTVNELKGSALFYAAVFVPSRPKWRAGGAADFS